MIRRAFVSGCVVAVVGLLAAQAAVAVPSAAWPTPKVGTWKLTQSFGETRAGTFTVTSSHANVKALKTTVGPNSVQYCGSGAVSVIGKQPIHLVGKGNSRSYIVGKKLDGTKSWGVAPINVTVHFGKKNFPGQMNMKFDSATEGEGIVNFNPIPGYACDLSFFFHKTK